MSIALFVGLKIRLDGRDLTGLLPGRQGRALIAHLTLNRHRSISRDELLDVLWPERPPASPEAALSSVLAKVRRALEPATIDGRHALTLRLPDGAQIDVETLDAQIERAERALADADATTALASAQAALALLAQPLLPDLDGEWIEPWRERFGDLTPRALDTAARAGIALGARRLPSAERAAASLVKLEPFREGAYALLMRAQAGQGNAAEALRTFEQLRSLLRDELGASPSAPLIALHESLLRAQEQAPGVPPIAAQTTDRVLPAATVQMIGGAFVGRDEHVQRLRARWASCHPGPSQLVLLVGEAGVGKSRLAAEFADEVHANGGTVLYGRADEEALLPHQSFVEALRHLITHADSTLLAALEPDRDILSRLLPDLAAGTPERDAGAHGAEDTMRYRLFEAVATLLCAATSRSPVLLILDDLDWADKPTHLLLRHLLRHPLLTGLLVIGTVRHSSLGGEHALVDLVTDLRRERRYDRLTLPGLDQAATRALVADRLGRDVTPDFVRRLGEQTEGNAFFIEETIRALIEQGLAPGEIVTATSLERIGVPEGVAQIVGRRIRHLSPLAQEALTAASVVGRHFRLAVVARLVDVAPELVMGALEESMASGLVLELSDSVDVFSFSHALVREALYGSLSVSRRVRLHHGVADALERLARSADINPAELAHHFLLARHFAGAGPARRYSIAAGDRATQLLAYEEAVAHYTQAAALFDDDEAARCEVLLAVGRAQWRAGHDSARDTFRTVADSAVTRRDRDQLARAALGYTARYHESEYAGPSSHELLDAAIAAVGDGDSPRRVLLLSRLAGNLAFVAEQRGRAAQVSAEGLAMARRLGDESLVLAALMARHATRLDVCHLDERLALSEEFIGLCPGHREMLVERCHWRLYDLLEHGDVDGALAEQPRLEALAQELRQPQWRSMALGWRGLWAEMAGDVAHAERCAEECLRYGRRAGLKDALSTWAAKLVMLRRRQGRLDELSCVVQRLAHGDVRRTGWRSAHGLILAETGDEAAARAILRDELAGYADALPQFWLTNIAMLSELCVRLQDVDGAGRLYAALLPYAHCNVVVAYSSCWGPVERSLALLAATVGDEPLAARHAHAALARTRAMQAPLLTAELENLGTRTLAS